MGPVRQLDPVARRVDGEPFPERAARIAEMIAIVEARPVPAVVARQPRHAHQLRHAIDVEQRHEQRIREGVRDGREPPMAQRADEQSRVDHHSTPSARATLSAECQPVLVKPVAPVGAAVVRAIDAAHVAPLLLRADRLPRVERMTIDEPAQHVAFVDPAVGVERHAVLLRRRESLQAIQVVGHRRRRIGVAGEPVIPGRAGPCLRGQHRRRPCAARRRWWWW